VNTTVAAIILVFVISIFSSAGNKASRYPTTTEKLPTQITQTTVSSLEVPDPNYSAQDARSSIVTYIQKYRNADLSGEIADSIVRHAQTYNVNAKLATALIARESKFNPRALSSSGAMGLGQLLPSTCKGLGVEDGFDIDQNAKGTVRYLRGLLDRFKKYEKQVQLALGGYLEGPNAVERQLGYSEHTRTYVDDIINIYHKM
jgi:soluble lytic murein transglycosylase-like protein